MFSSSTFPKQHLYVGLVLKDRGWILEKMAYQLMDCLPEFNVTAELSTTPVKTADINHWMIGYDVQDQISTKSTLAITHVDRPIKFHVLRKRLQEANLGICMSRMTMEQLRLGGVPQEKLTFILPAHDADIEPKRVTIGLTTQLRPDGAKREVLLTETARSMRLDAFHFSIVGPRWEKVIPILEAAGATTDYSSGVMDNSEHRRLVLEKLKTFDFYLYMGWDEGSMGLLDALAAGIPTIVTPQGFHVDINDGITHPIYDSSDLCRVLEQISRERAQRINSVAKLTRREYARKHALLWHALDHGNVRLAKRDLEQTEFSTHLEDIITMAKAKKLFPYPGKYTMDSLKSDIYLLLDYYTKGWFVRSNLAALLRRWSKSLKR